MEEAACWKTTYSHHNMLSSQQALIWRHTGIKWSLRLFRRPRQRRSASSALPGARRRAAATRHYGGPRSQFKRAGGGSSCGAASSATARASWPCRPSCAGIWRAADSSHFAPLLSRFRQSGIPYSDIHPRTHSSDTPKEIDGFWLLTCLIWHCTEKSIDQRLGNQMLKSSDDICFILSICRETLRTNINKGGGPL